MKLRIIILFFFCSIYNLVLSQECVVSGTITDDDGKTIVGATVYVEALQKGAVSDIDGAYSLTLPYGKHTLQFSFIGYKTYTTTLNLSSSKKKCNVRLYSENEMLDAVVVTDRRSDAKIRDVKMSVEHLETKQIKKIPALLGEVDIIKAIQMLPGVQAAAEGSSGLSIRGGSPDQNLVLLDDAPVYNPSHFLGFFSVFNNDVVKGATLYKGDIPAYYPSRLSAVLDVATYDDIPDTPNINGGLGILTSHLSLRTPVVRDKTAVMFGGRATYAGIFFPLFGDKLKDKNIYFYDLNAKIVHVFNKNNRLFISGYYGKDLFKMSGVSSISYGNATASARWNHIFSNRISSNLSLIFSNYIFNIDVYTNPFNWTMQSGVRDFNAKYDVACLWNEKNSSHFGISSTHHTYNIGKLNDRGGALSLYLEVDPNRKVERKGLEHAFYFNNEHSFTEDFSIRYGLRLSIFQNIGYEKFYKINDQHEIIDTIFYKDGEIFNTMWNLEPRIAMKYVLDKYSSVKASYSRTAQYAQLATNATGGLPLDVWFPANPNIKPQLCDQIAVGYFRNFLDNSIEFSFETYYKFIDNVIDFEEDAFLFANSKIDKQVHTGHGRSYGFEVLLRKDVGDLTGWIGYSYSRTFRTVEGINHDKEYVSPFDHPHNINFVLNYTLNHHVDISLNWVYATGQPVTYPYAKYSVNGETYAVYNGSRNASRYPDYHRLDLSLTWKVPTMRRWQSEWNFSIFNAYGRHNVWAVTFETGEDETIKTNKIYLFGIIPSVTYNFKF